MENLHDSIDATYSPEDNKLRLYSAIRLDSELYERVKAMGFKYAPKQELFVAPKWTPSREDFCLELAGEITAEQTTLSERAEAKSERLDNLSIKRRQQANAFYEAATRISERFAYGQPILIGHHSERKARKDKARMESAMNQSVKAAQAVDYWNYRAEGVERHANHKSNPGVIARRIKTLLAELRDRQRTLNHAQICLALWEKISGIENEDDFKKQVEYYAGGALNTGSAAPWGLWSELDKGKITHKEVVEKCINNDLSILNGQYTRRWISHLLNRLAFERSELGEVACFDGDITKAILQTFVRTHGAHKPVAIQEGENWKVSSTVDLPLHIIGGKELVLSDDEWRNLMQSSGYEVPAIKQRKAIAKKSVSLINPTKEEAEKLQAIWNQIMVNICKSKQYQTAKMAEITEVVQAVYSANSGGDYDKFKTIELDIQGREVCHKWQGGLRVKTGEAVCRIRVYTGGFDFNKASSIAVINDKPGKALPIEWDEINAETEGCSA